MLLNKGIVKEEITCLSSSFIIIIQYEHGHYCYYPLYLRLLLFRALSAWRAAFQDEFRNPIAISLFALTIVITIRSRMDLMDLMDPVDIT